jgi:hypothetical protein
MTKQRLTKAQREAQREADLKEFHRQCRVLRIRPWESRIFAPINTRNALNPFEPHTAEHDRWEKMAAIQRRLDERRAKRAAMKQQQSEESK